MPTSTWLSFECLCVETALEMEKRHKLGNIICQSMRDNLQDGLKQCKIASVDQLTIFRWVYFINNLPNDDELLPLFWQLFLSLFFSNVTLPLNPRSTEPVRRSFGALMLATSLPEVLKALEIRLNQLVEYFRDKINVADNPAREFDAASVEYYSLVRVWLLEPKLRSFDLNLNFITDAFNPVRLIGLFDFSFWMNPANLQQLWTDLVQPRHHYLEATRTSIFGDKPILEVLPSLKTLVVEQSKASSILQQQSRDPFRNMVNLSAKYALPVFVISDFISVFNVASLTESNALIGLLDREIQLLLQYADMHSSIEAALFGVDAEFLELLPALHVNEDRMFDQFLNCTSSRCKGPAEFHFRLKQYRVNGHVKANIDANRAAYTDLLGRQTTTEAVFAAAQRVDKVLSAVNDYCMSPHANPSLKAVLVSAAQNFYFYLLKLLKSSALHYPPTSLLLPDKIQLLGKQFVAPDPSQVERVLRTMLHSVDNIDLVLPSFCPNLSPESFCSLYVKTCEDYKGVGLETGMAILRKFDVEKWLSSRASTQSTRFVIIS